MSYAIPLREHEQAPRATPRAEPSAWTDTATSSAVRSGKHTIVWGAMLSIAWGAAIVWLPEATGAIVMGGVVMAMMTAGHILIVVGHAAQLAEDERQRLRDLDADTRADAEQWRAHVVTRKAELAAIEGMRWRADRDTRVGDAVWVRPAPNPTRPETRRM